MPAWRSPAPLAPLSLVLAAGAAFAAAALVGCAAKPAAQQAAAEPAPSGQQAITVPGVPLTMTEVPQWTAVINGKEVPAPSIPMGDPATVARILDEGKNRNQVMQHIATLSNQYGPRLTGSTRLEQSAAWIKSQYQAWGLDAVYDEQWGTIATRFDRGPSTGKVLLRAPRGRDDNAVGEAEAVREMQFSTLSWTAGTSGPVRGKVFKLPEDEAAYAKLKPQLKGAWILLPAPPPAGQRGMRSRAASMFEARIAARKDVAEGKKKPEDIAIRDRLIFDGVAGFLSCTRDERVWTGGAPGWRERAAADIPPDVHVSIRMSDYDFINSRLADGEDVLVEFDLKHDITPGPIPVYNTIAEIKGSELPDEVVIISGHLDSWDGPGSQGTIDNGTGTAVTLETARILRAVGAKPRRTIRFVHWTGEEQGLLGAVAYVELRKKDGTLEKVSAMFNDDGGTNSQGGMPCIASMAPYLAAASAPTNNQFFDAVSGKPLNVNVRIVDRMPMGGSSDHAAFNRAGIPGFYWDEVGRADYGFGWHTQNDRLNLALEDYLRQSATNSAIVAYRLACAPDLLPREPRRPAGQEQPPTGDGSTAPATGGTPATPPAAAPTQR